MNGVASAIVHVVGRVHQQGRWIERETLRELAGPDGIGRTHGQRDDRLRRQGVIGGDSAAEGLCDFPQAAGHGAEIAFTLAIATGIAGRRSEGLDDVVDRVGVANIQGSGHIEHARPAPGARDDREVLQLVGTVVDVVGIVGRDAERTEIDAEAIVVVDPVLADVVVDPAEQVDAGAIEANQVLLDEGVVIAVGDADAGSVAEILRTAAIGADQVVLDRDIAGIASAQLDPGQSIGRQQIAVGQCRSADRGCRVVHPDTRAGVACRTAAAAVRPQKISLDQHIADAGRARRVAHDHAMLDKSGHGDAADIAAAGANCQAMSGGGGRGCTVNANAQGRVRCQLAVVDPGTRLGVAVDRQRLGDRRQIAQWLDQDVAARWNSEDVKVDGIGGRGGICSRDRLTQRAHGRTAGARRVGAAGHDEGGSRDGWRSQNHGDDEDQELKELRESLGHGGEPVCAVRPLCSAVAPRVCRDVAGP